ncbi:MAG: glycosyltransferase family 2 protein [Myxococcota bacterium]
MEENSPPELSIVVPVYNEEAMISGAVESLVGGLDAIGRAYEIVLAENGSSDATAILADELGERFDQVRMRRTAEPNYGKALRDGILNARGDIVVCEEIDLCDLDFLSRALHLLDTNQADLVVGSKAMEGADDARPLSRRVGTRAINLLLRWTLGFRGTDTHGLKAFRRDALAPVARRCVAEKDLFASELVIRAEREGIAVREIPVSVREKRPPTVGLLRRVPGVMTHLAKLIIAIRVRK